MLHIILEKTQAFEYLHQFPLVQLVGSCSASMCQHTAFDKSREARITAREKNKVREHYDKVSSPALELDVSQQHSNKH